MSGPADHHDRTILVIDDTPANLSVVIDHLAGHGFQIEVARDGEGGLRLARQERPDLILLDVRLPGIDGFETCRRLKADEQTLEIPVIFMTVVDNTEDKVMGFGAGGVDYITKPLQQEEVLARVTTHLCLRELTRKLEDANEGLERRVEERTAELAQTNARMARESADRKRAEESVRRLNQDLEQRVIQRTAQLEGAYKELEAFAYSVSHDLRAPLRHIDGFLELFQKHLPGPLDERSEHYMSNIVDAVTRMSTLIDDLLTFSRMGREELVKMPVDMGALVQDVVRELAPEADGRSVTWQIGELPTVTGDRAMLRQVLVNLVSNALKFTQGKAPEIEIGCEHDSGQIIVFVRDNGVGFDMTYADKLFGVFQRLHAADEFEGTGIGLANVRRIIQRHDGRTWAEGELEQGATFYFSLPQPTVET